MVTELGAGGIGDSGLSDVGAVVGATQPGLIEELRARCRPPSSSCPASARRAVVSSSCAPPSLPGERRRLSQHRVRSSARPSRAATRVSPCRFAEQLREATWDAEQRLDAPVSRHPEGKPPATGLLSRAEHGRLQVNRAQDARPHFAGRVRGDLPDRDRELARRRLRLEATSARASSEQRTETRTGEARRTRTAATGATGATGASGNRRVYVVKAGDTLVKIADNTGVPIEELLSLNPSIDPQGLVTGQRVKLRE